ncbi:MAG: hypothetical protein MHPDNHAH_02275 [Anaerolineales bacterium]|nr:hypothetical protein [Anaerolineales bacterium]
MNSSKTFVIAFLCLSLILSSCGIVSESKDPKEAVYPISQEELYLLVDRGDMTPPEIARELELKPNKTYKDLIDLGTSYIWMGEYLKAAEAYEVGAREADTKAQLVGALYNKSIALGYANQIREALQTLDYLVNIDPENIHVAWLRYAFYRYAGSNFGMTVAADHLITLDPSLSGNEVLGPLETVIIVSAIFVVITSATVITVYTLTPPEDRKEIIKPLMDNYSDIVGGESKALGSYGYLLVQALKGTK